MPFLKKSDLDPPFWLPNGHMQSIYPAIFRKIEGVNYQRERISTADLDFLDLDWSLAKRESAGSRLVILSHGLEGNSTRPYVLGMVRLLNQNGYDCLAWNYRSCGGEMNKTSRFYHSGATEDLEAVINHSIGKGYANINLIGFSLGGNLTLKFLGEAGPEVNRVIKKAVVFSAPMDLKVCSLAIAKSGNRIYMHRFLRTLKAKVYEKSPLFPGLIRTSDLNHVRTLYDFDHIYTAPLHGFDSADHYYAQCSAMYFVERINVPTCIVHAMNDPIVPYTSLPLGLLGSLRHVFLEMSNYGGHCGFTPSTLLNGVYWSESKALGFIDGPQER